MLPYRVDRHGNMLSPWYMLVTPIIAVTC